jgi:hypothetical protein
MNTPYNPLLFIPSRQYSPGKRTKMYSHESREFRERLNKATNSKEKTI